MITVKSIPGRIEYSDGVHTVLATANGRRGDGWNIGVSWSVHIGGWVATKADVPGTARRLLKERARGLRATRLRVLAAMGPDVETASPELIDRLTVEFSR